MTQETSTWTGVPLLSLIIPTRNRRAQIRECLTSLAAQTYPRADWEVIVVFDGDEGGAGRGSGSIGGRLQLRFLSQPHSGCGIARNAGAAEAHGR